MGLPAMDSPSLSLTGVTGVTGVTVEVTECPMERALENAVDEVMEVMEVMGVVEVMEVVEVVGEEQVVTGMERLPRPVMKIRSLEVWAAGEGGLSQLLAAGEEVRATRAPIMLLPRRAVAVEVAVAIQADAGGEDREDSNSNSSSAWATTPTLTSDRGRCGDDDVVGGRVWLWFLSFFSRGLELCISMYLTIANDSPFWLSSSFFLFFLSHFILIKATS